MSRTIPSEPTSDQCSNQERVADVEGNKAYACWYPQMGGYVGKCVVIIDKCADEADVIDYCFDAYVWHDGEFPFRGSKDKDPCRIHHCSPGQFVDFGNFVLKLQKEINHVSE